MRSIRTINNQPASPASFRWTQTLLQYFLPYDTLRHLYSSTFSFTTTYVIRSVGLGRLDGIPSATATTLALAPAAIPPTLLSARLQPDWTSTRTPAPATALC